MADVPQAITVNGDTYKVPGKATIEPLAASVSYDGAGASGAFIPCLSIYSQSGHLISRTFPQSAVAQGASAEVSFIPFVPPASGDLHWGTNTDSGNQGLTLTGAGQPWDFNNAGGGWSNETGGGGYSMDTGGGGYSVATHGGAISLRSGGGGIQVDDFGGGTIVTASGGLILTVPGASLNVVLSPTDQLGFFGATPIVQPAHPTTLGDVITALTALGLTA